MRPLGWNLPDSGGGRRRKPLRDAGTVWLCLLWPFPGPAHVLDPHGSTVWVVAQESFLSWPFIFQCTQSGR